MRWRRRAAALLPDKKPPGPQPGRVHAALLIPHSLPLRERRSEKETLNLVSGMPFFVQLYGTFQDPYYCYFLMEYAVGGELFTQLHIQRRFSEDRARFYSCEVLCALEALHLHHVMFRDLKPENLLLDERGHIKASEHKRFRGANAVSPKFVHPPPRRAQHG